MIVRTLAASLLSLLVALPAPAQQAPNSEAEQALKRLRPPKGLQASLFAAEPDFVNPVAFTFDEKGRAYVVETHRLGNCTYDIRGHMAWADDDLACRTVADREAMHRKYLGDKYEKLTESERVRFLEDRDGDGRVDHAVTFAEGFGTPATGLAAGVLARGDDVWFACIPDLWKFKNVDGKGSQQTALHTGFGVRIAFIGHDLHGLRFGPDGKLYFTIGDRGVHVEKDGKVLVDNPDSGCVMRCNPDGSGLEVFATGLRNPQKLAFDAFGNLWTGDNNCDAGDAARWTYIMEGGDCGWRVGYQQAPGRGPWMSEKLWGMDVGQTAPSEVPPVAHIGHGPAGICFNGGVGLPEAYKDHFFFTDFPGSVLSFAVKPKGAGFEATDLKTFVGDVWPTDVEIGTDGAVYFSDWVNGWGMPNKGRIYRIADPGRAASAEVQETKAILAKGMSERTVEDLKTFLAHPDQRVRTAAQFALVDLQAGAALREAAKAGPLLAKIHAIWGLGQLGMVDTLVASLADDEPEVRAQAAKVLGERRVAAAFDRLVLQLKHPSLRVRSFAAIALGKLGRKEAIGPLFDLLRENADQDPWLRHAGVIALVWLGDLEAILARRNDDSSSIRLACLLALRRLNRADVAGFLEDKEPAIAFEAARAISDAPVNAALPALAAMLDKKLPEKAWTRAINAAYRTPDAAVLVRFAARKDVSDAARSEALKALSEWAHPSGRDRLIHVWRPLPDREATAARDGLSPAVDGLLDGGSETVQEAAAHAAGALEIASAGPKLAQLAARGKSVGVRIAALKALAALKDDRLAVAVMSAVEDKDAALRKEGTKLLAQLKAPNVVALLEKLASEDGPIGVRQNAVDALGRMQGGDSEKALSRLLDALLAGALPAGLTLDVLEAASPKRGLADKVARVHAGDKSDDPVAPYRDALVGGDADSGRKIFYEKAEASCAKCHKVQGRGGEVGPVLDAIGGQKTRDYLLESIVLPNKEIAQGFAQSIFQLQSDAIETGRVEKEDERQVVLLLADGTRKTIAKSDIKARKVGLSAMPEDEVKHLTKRELRDVIEFLASLKGR
ncbi:MAG TPA: PVC-type heme-binding CxxCH protein [Planctomycetota bacterium]|nr:PVC-type heme-binding CxxCH protein [Planctomycetota bacterium]